MYYNSDVPKTNIHEFCCWCPNRVLGLSTAGGGERHIGQDGQGRAGQLRGHVLVVVILAAELPSREGVMHTTPVISPVPPKSGHATVARVVQKTFFHVLCDMGRYICKTKNKPP